MSRVVADIADLERVARHLDAAAAELVRVAEQVAALAGALPVPVAQVLLDVGVPVERGLTAEARGVSVLAGELRLVGHAIERAMAGGIDPRLAVDGRDWLRQLERRHGGPPPLWPLALVSPIVDSPERRTPGSGGQLPAVTGQPRGGSSRALGVALVVMGGLLALWALAQSQSGGSVSSPSQQLKLQDLRRQQKQKAVSQALAAAPKPPPGPKQQNEIERSATELGVDQARFESLARDPARGWTVDDNSIEEARIAVRLERSGRLHDVVRSPYPRSDLVEDEGAGQEWCVKSPRGSNFDVNVTIGDIRDELTTGNNIVVNTAHLNAAQTSELQQAVDVLGWSDRVLFASSE